MRDLLTAERGPMVAYQHSPNPEADICNICMAYCLFSMWCSQREMGLGIFLRAFDEYLGMCRLTVLKGVGGPVDDAEGETSSAVHVQLD